MFVHQSKFVKKKYFNRLVYIADGLFQYFVGGNAALIGQKIITSFPDVKVSSQQFEVSSQQKYMWHSAC